MVNLLNGSGNGWAKLLAPVIVSALIGGGVLVQSQSQNAGVSEQMLEVITDIHRLQENRTELIRRIENLDQYQASGTARLANVDTQIALIEREKENLLEEVGDFYEGETKIKEAIDAFERRLISLEYNMDRLSKEFD